MPNQNITESKTGSGKRAEAASLASVSRVCAHLSLALRTGVPLSQALDADADGYAGQKDAGCFEQLAGDLQQGCGLSEAMERTGAFPKTVPAMVRIGEQTGTADEVLHELSDTYAWEDEVRAAVRSAVLYPALLALMLSGILAVLLVRVMPVFRRVFSGLGAAASAADPLSAGTAVGIAALGFTMLLALFLLWMLLRLSRGDGQGARRVMAVFPPARRVMLALCRSRFAGAMQTLCAAGCPLDGAVRLAADTVGDAPYEARALRAAAAMEQGTPLADALEGEALFERADVRHIRFGANASCADSVFAEIAGRCRCSAEEELDRTVSLIEPVLVVTLAVVIGSILLSVLLPLLQLFAAMA